MSGRVNRSQFSLDSQNNHMFNSQLRKQFSQFHHQDAGSSSGSGSGNHKRVTPQSDLGSSSGSSRSRRRRRRRGTSQGSHLLPEAISRYAPQTYDAVWAIALALRAAEEHWRKDAAQSKLDGFDYTRSDMAWEFLQQLGKLHFLGVSVSGRRRGATKNREISRGIGLLSLLSLSLFISLCMQGPVSFSGPDRVGTTAFYQIQRGLLEPVALYYPATDALDFRCPRCRPVKWHSGQVPIAKRVFKLRVATIAPLAFYTIATLSSVGIALAIAFLAFNLHFRKLK